MRILAVSPYGNACGIADYADQLRRALERIGAPIDPFWTPGAVTLNPSFVLDQLRHSRAPEPDLVWINHHAALHARWDPAHVQELQDQGIPVVITLHDTRAGYDDSRNTDQLRRLYEVADHTIVHEPVADLEGVSVIRHGIPPAPRNGWVFGVALATPQPDDLCFLRYQGQPILGTVGFNFPWKNYDRLTAVCREIGWAQVILSNDATEADEARWRAINPWMLVVREFLPQSNAIQYLMSCSATAFCYECANNGTSGAIRQGIAARKPVYAFKGCRQFRDLLIAEATEEPGPLIRWVDDFDHLRVRLKMDPLPLVDPGVVYLAERDSWDRQATMYLQIFETARARRRQTV